jgi:murein DD-endopeptidase MepM/ murein hydrolase activator NlpD
MGASGSSSDSPTTRREARAREAAARSADVRRRPKKLRTIPTPDARERRATAAQRHSVGRQALTFAAMAFSMLLAVGVSIPASAFGGPATTLTGTASTAPTGTRDLGAAQDVSVSSGSAAAPSARDDFTVILPKPKEVFSGAGEPSVPGICTVGASGPIRWATDTSPAIGHGVTESHHGQDLLIANGTPVHAVSDGTVLVSGTEGSYGQYVVIQGVVGGHTVTSLYAHMQIGSQTVSAGQTVTMGQVIGLVGSSGSATGYLLYLRILQDGQLCDTITYISGDPAGGAAPHAG